MDALHRSGWRFGPGGGWLPFGPEVRQARLATLRSMTALLAAVDIGATSIKATLLGDGSPRVRSRRTQPPVGPDEVIEKVCDLLSALGPASRVVVGFPGPLEGGQVRSACNLDPEGLLGWSGFDLEAGLTEHLGCEVACANDADLAALGAAHGKGLELTVTLGTGVGTGITLDGTLEEHRELSDLPIASAPSLDAYVGEPTRKLLEPEVWDQRVVEVLELLDTEVRPDQIWLAGGNARRVTRSRLGRLEEKVWVVSTPVGLLGAQRFVSP